MPITYTAELLSADRFAPSRLSLRYSGVIFVTTVRLGPALFDGINRGGVSFVCIHGIGLKSLLLDEKSIRAGTPARFNTLSWIVRSRFVNGVILGFVFFSVNSV